MQLIVVGMHRSGTSMLNRILGLLGCNMGNVNLDNDHWEQSQVKQINDALLANVGATWRSATTAQLAALEDSVTPKQHEEIQSIVRTMDVQQPWTLKDPRHCLTFEAWHAALESPIYLHVARHPLEVAMSLRTREGMPLPVGLALWELYVCNAAWHLARHAPILVNYGELLEAPREQVERIVAELGARGVDFPAESVAQAASFIVPGSRHERAQDESDLTSRQRELWTVLQSGKRPAESEVSEGSVELLAAYQDRLSLSDRAALLERELAARDEKVEAKVKLAEEAKSELRKNKSQQAKSHKAVAALEQSLGKLGEETRALRKETAEERKVLSEALDGQGRRIKQLLAEQSTATKRNTEISEHVQELKKRVLLLNDAETRANEFETRIASADAVLAGINSERDKLLLLTGKIRSELDALILSKRWQLGNRAGHALTMLRGKGKEATPVDAMVSLLKRLESHIDGLGVGSRKLGDARKGAVKTAKKKEKRVKKRKAATAPLSPEEMLRAFRKGPAREWSLVAGSPRTARRGKPKVMVGTLSSGENEHDRCIASVKAQRYGKLDHKVFEGLGKKDAVSTLMETFERSKADILLKVDADMVLLDPNLVQRVVDVFTANPNVDMLQMAITDFFSGGPIQGINAYRKGFGWSTGKQDKLFTDRTKIVKERRMVNWTTFVDDVIHCPDPSPFQAFHFGVHRALKVLQPEGEFQRERAIEQLVYLERTWRHFGLRRDRRLGFACLGFEYALHEDISVSELDYTDPRLHERFELFAEFATKAIEEEVRRRREAPVARREVEDLRKLRDALAEDFEHALGRVVAVLPHFGVFGGVNRFFEIARSMGALGYPMALTAPDEDFELRADFPDVEQLPLSDALQQSWDVALCGDVFHGVALLLPSFDAKATAMYVLNGWQHHHYYREQVDVVQPDAVLANSSYAREQYLDFAPTLVAGGVALRDFSMSERNLFSGKRLRLCAYPGRNKPRKRFDDVLRACEILHERGVDFELHVFDHSLKDVDTSFPLINHGILARPGVAELYSSCDIAICPEEDAGWSNPAAEAMASGCVVVCTRAGTIDFARDAETALLVDTRAPEQIVEAVERLIDDREFAETLRQAGREAIREYDWSAVARRMIDVLTTLRRNSERRTGINHEARKRVQALVA